MAAAFNTPKLKKRPAAGGGRSKRCSADHRSQPIERVNRPDQSGATGMGETTSRWGHSSECFSFIKDWGGEEGQAPSGACSDTKGLSTGNDGIGGWLYDASRAVQRLSSATRRAESRPQQDRSPIKLWREAKWGAAQCGKSACCGVRRWRGLETWHGRAACRARQSSTLPVGGRGAGDRLRRTRLGREVNSRPLPRKWNGPTVKMAANDP